MTARDGGRRPSRLEGVLSIAALSVVMSLLALTVAGRTLRAPPAALGAGIAFLPYVFLISGGLLLLAWTAAPRRPALPLSLALLAASGFLLWGPRFASPPEDGEPLRVMS